MKLYGSKLQGDVLFFSIELPLMCIPTTTKYEFNDFSVTPITLNLNSHFYVTY